MSGFSICILIAMFICSCGILFIYEGMFIAFIISGIIFGIVVALAVNLKHEEKIKCSENYKTFFINSVMKKEKKEAINNILVFSSLYSGVPVEKMSITLYADIEYFVITSISKGLQYSEFKDELNALIWNHLANENQLKEIDITTLPKDSKLMQYLNQQTIDITTSFSRKTTLMVTDKDIEKINKLVAKFIHKFITYEPMDNDYILMNGLSFSIIVCNEINQARLQMHGDEFYKRITASARKFKNCFLKLYKQEESIDSDDYEKLLNLASDFSKLIDKLLGIDSTDTTETNAVFEFYDAMEKECIKIIDDFYKELEKSTLGAIPNKNEVTIFFVKNHFISLRNNFYKISKEEQNKLINKFIQDGDYKKRAKTNCIPFLQDKILQVFQTNNFNNQYIYIYNDLTPIARTLRMLYKWILKKGLETNVINENDYKELMQVLADTIKENKYM